MDLRGNFILNNNLDACSWKSFHELHYNYLLHITFFHAFFLHIFSMNNIISHVRTNFFSLTHSSPLFFPLQNTQNTSILLVSLPWPLLELIFLVQWKFENPSLQSMASSSFMKKWQSRMIFFLMEFRMKFFMPNETLRRLHSLIK